MRHLFWNPVTGFIVLFILACFAGTPMGYGQWLDPLFWLGIGWLLFHYGWKRSASVPWAVSILQLALTVQIDLVGALLGAALILGGYCLLWDWKIVRPASVIPLGDLYLRLEEMNDIVVTGGIGDVTIDLSQAIVTEGEWRVRIHRWIGNVTLYLSYDLEMALESKTVAGSIEAMEERRTGWNHRLALVSNGYEKAEGKVHLIVSTVVGDVAVKRI